MTWIARTATGKSGGISPAASFLLQSSRCRFSAPRSPTSAPSSSTATRSDVSRPSSTPSVTRAATLRLLNCLFYEAQVCRKFHIDGVERRSTRVGFTPMPRTIDAAAKQLINDHEIAQHPLANGDGLDFGQLKSERGAVPASTWSEHPRLAVVVGETFRTNPELVTLLMLQILRGKVVYPRSGVPGGRRDPGYWVVGPRAQLARAGARCHRAESCASALGAGWRPDRGS